MPIKDRLQVFKDRAEDLLSRLEQMLQSIFERLLSKRRWFAVLSASLSDFWKKKMYYYCGYFTYNGFLAMLALIVAASAIVGFLTHYSSSSREHVAKALKNFLPVFGAAPTSTVKAMDDFRNVVGIIGLIALVWTGTKMFSSLEWGFCEITGSKRRTFARGKVLGAGLISAVGLIFLFSILVQFAFAAFWSWAVGKHGGLHDIGIIVFKPIMVLILNFLLFLVIFKVVPTVKQSLRRCAIGAFISSVLFLGIQYLLGYYFGHISSLPSIYGNLSTVVVLIIWLHLVGMITFIGEEIVYMMSNEDVVTIHQAQTRLPKLFKLNKEDGGNRTDVGKG